jgi:hypothetical protein
VVGCPASAVSDSRTVAHHVADDRGSTVTVPPSLIGAAVISSVSSARHHTPCCGSYQLSTVDGSFMGVDLKQLRRLDDPAVRLTFDWAREIAVDCSWGFEVFSEPDPVLLGNVRFLAGYRRGWLFDPDLLPRARVDRGR